MKTALLALYHYRGFIQSIVLRDFQLHYQGTMLGIAWLIIQPLTMILVYTLIFANIMQAKLVGVEGIFAYSIYLCTGILTWRLFTEILSRSTQVFLENANLLKKLKFPKICLPVIATITGLLSFCIIFSLFTIFLLISQNFPGWVYLYTFPVIAVLLLFVTSLGIILGILNVFFRDTGQFIHLVLQFWFWLTPIVYPKRILPIWSHSFLDLNPMLPIMEAMQTIFVQHQRPSFFALSYPLILSCILFMFGLRLFKKHSGEIVDEI